MKKAKVLSTNGVITATANQEVLKELEIADGMSTANGLSSPELTQISVNTECQFKMNGSYFTLLAETAWSTTDTVDEFIIVTEGAEVYCAFTF